MAGKKLSDRQWRNLKQSLDRGTSAATLAEQYGITRQAIYKRYGSQRADAKIVANQIIEASETLNKSLQKFTNPVVNLGWDIAADLMEISRHSCQGAKYSAQTFHKFAKIANDCAEEAMFLGAKQGLEAKVMSDVYQISANEAFKPVANLLNSNKDRMESLGKPQDTSLDDLLESI